MNIIFYTFILIVGILFGSFFTLAIYRLPKKQDILYTRSYCPKCNHRLGLIDLIPVLSYIFLGAKCRYCKEKIPPRYILMEVISGVIYLLFVISLKIHIFNLTPYNVGFLIVSSIFYAVCFINIGIALEKHKISNVLCCCFYISASISIVYACILKVNIYTYAIFVIFIILNFIAILRNKMRYKNEY